MKESEFVRRWESERNIYRAWGDYVTKTLLEQVEAAPGAPPLDAFFKIWPVIPRIKGTQSLVDKAFYRGKRYADPYRDITDKVGVRFVVLLTSDIRKVENIILNYPGWEATKDRDYEEDRLARPLEFDYQSVHYILRVEKAVDVNGVSVPPGICCEVQIRTLLQHAHSELTHDNIYKPKTTAEPPVRRAVAKSMALIEAADEFFERVVADLSKAGRPLEAALETLARLYLDKVGVNPESGRSNLLVMDAFVDKLGSDLEQDINSFLDAKPYVATWVATRAVERHLFRQPSILVAYLMANARPSETKEIWPLEGDDLKFVYTDLGLNYESL